MRISVTTSMNLPELACESCEYEFEEPSHPRCAICMDDMSFDNGYIPVGCFGVTDERDL